MIYESEQHLIPLYRIAYTQLIGFFERTKYYAIWKLTEVRDCVTVVPYMRPRPESGNRAQA